MLRYAETSCFQKIAISRQFFIPRHVPGTRANRFAYQQEKTAPVSEVRLLLVRLDPVTARSFTGTLPDGT
jgi:hypothetical protein